MWGIVLDWLKDNCPLLLVAIIVVSAIVVATWKVFVYYNRFKKVEDGVATSQERITNLPCDRHTDMFRQISEDLLQIKTYLMTKNPSAASAFSVKMSPRRLNDAGQQLFSDINGMEFLGANEAFLLSCIDRKKPKTALDVEVAANEVLFENLQDDIFNGLKNWVYNSPTRPLTVNNETREHAVTMGDVCFVLSLPLRDVYLRKHPEITM